MRIWSKWLIGLLLFISSSLVAGQTIPPTPDIFASATAQIRGATQTAQAETDQPTLAATQDPFVLTATALIRQATGTAERLTGATAVPLTVTQDNFALTATALIAEATRIASAQAADSAQTPAEEDPLSAALLIFFVVVLLLGAVGFVLLRRNHEKRKL